MDRRADPQNPEEIGEVPRLFLLNFLRRDEVAEPFVQTFVEPLIHNVWDGLLAFRFRGEGVQLDGFGMKVDIVRLRFILSDIDLAGHRPRP